MSDASGSSTPEQAGSSSFNGPSQQPCSSSSVIKTETNYDNQQPGPSGISRNQSSIKTELKPSTSVADNYDSDDGGSNVSYNPNSNGNSMQLLTAPDLQLDWLSDSTETNDDVIYVPSPPAIDLTTESSDSEFDNIRQGTGSSSSRRLCDRVHGFYPIQPETPPLPNERQGQQQLSESDPMLSQR